MCGIAGLLLHSPVAPDPELLRRMAGLMASRGPDDEGLFVSQHIGLAHRRLSIRDLSPLGRCPMSTADGQIHITFNGEVYNWRELRRELEEKGCAFASQSDTEVILRGYEIWGAGVAERLNGMFAFAIWDGRESRLFLARDRAGEKPLFYAVTRKGLAFASSLEALKPVQARREIDPIGMACYLAHSFIPSRHTIWQGARVLPPATCLTLVPGGIPQLRRYWEFPRVGPAKSSKGCEAAVEAALDDAVSRCLDADVPVGVFLSGGVDSSLIAALAARQRPSIEAFSLGFAEARYSELKYARQVASHLKLTHRTVEIGAADVLSCLPNLVAQYGQPFGDASAIPTYFVSRLARQRVKVCLSGDGGDECFGGYWRLQSGVYAAHYSALLPQAFRARYVPGLAAILGPLGTRWKALNDLSLAPPGASYTNAESWFSRLGELAGPALEPALKTDLTALRVGNALGRAEASIVQSILYDDFQVQLPDAYLTKVDVASMAASLEVRAPFLERRVLELSWGIPDRMKLNWGRRKWLLKRIAARHVPREAIYRPKMGFGMPLAEWFRGELGGALEGLLRSSVAVEAGWIRSAPVLHCLDEHRRGKDHATRLWLILWLEHWFRLQSSVATAAPEKLQNMLLRDAELTGDARRAAEVSPQ